MLLSLVKTSLVGLQLLVSNFHFGVLVYCFKEVYFLVGLEVRQCFFKYWLIDLALKLIKRCSE